MRHLTLVATIGLLAAVAAAPFASQAPAARQEAGQERTGAAAPGFKAKKLTRAEFDALTADPGRVLVVDVRRPDELTSIGGFGVYLSVQAGDLEKRLDWIPRDRRVVTVSNHAARAGRAADLLASRGFTVAGAIGAQDYEAEGGALVKVAPPAPRAATEGR